MMGLRQPLLETAEHATKDATAPVPAGVGFTADGLDAAARAASEAVPRQLLNRLDWPGADLPLPVRLPRESGIGRLLWIEWPLAIRRPDARGGLVGRLLQALARECPRVRQVEPPLPFRSRRRLPG